MGYLLKEALKTLCGVHRWCYAVFWKICSQNPNGLLVWEECYYDSATFGGLPGNSGIESPELGFEDWCSAGAYNSHVGVRAGNGLHLLANKMMMGSHVHVLGEGLIGRAAFTGCHEWILSENYRKDSHPPEVLKEISLQFSAGMQTIAVIPILPHGVVQLGSYIPMMENVAFVNDVKSLVLQLGCVPGVLLSENYATKEPTPKIGMPVCSGNSFTGNYIERSEVYNSTPLIADCCDYKCNLTQTVPYGSQTCLAGQLLDASVCHASDLGGGFVVSHDDKRQAKTGTLANPDPASTNQLANIVAKPEIIFSNPEVWLTQQASLSNPRSTFDQKPASGSSVVNGGSLKFMEQQISSETCFRGHTNGSFNISSDTMMPVLGSNAGLVSGTSQDSVSFHSANISDLGGVNNSLQSISNFNSRSDANLLSCKNSSSTHTRNESQIANSSKSEVSFTKVVDHPSERNLLTSSSFAAYSSADNKFIGVDLDDILGRLEHDLYQALKIPLSKQDVNSSLSECIPGLTPKDEKQEYGFQTVSLGDAMHWDACGQLRSGDDLFDIFGVDFRNKLLNCEWNSSQSSVSDLNITYLDKNNSTSLKATEASKNPYRDNQGQSNNSIFSVTSADHLLEAVISGVQPSVSCRTTLTNASSLSALDASPSCSKIGASGQIQGDLFAFPKSLTNPGSLGLCSLASGTSKDSKLHYSNSGSICGPQISSWIEQQDVKPSSSASTAYSKKTDEMSKTNRKRIKPGENPRPRPKDRQMIQDRVKELREIVPNGAKCSIDALLERTIKHMLFLQSVTKYADKLKQTGDSKIVGKESGLLIKDNYDGGATWAYEVGSQSMVCPIIVEDLNQPRQMLVEMLCEERGLFLEIADIIRGLGLTILKGVMETRNDKIWACFAVEANRDVTRMEIFISLVRLLEQTTKNGVAPANCLDNKSMMVHQFQQATSISASGRPCDL